MTNRKSLKRSAGIILGALLLAGAQPASATWQGATSGVGYVNGGDKDYTLAGNWTSTPIDNSFAGVSLTGDLTLYMDGALSAAANTGSLNFNYGGDYNLTLQSNNSATRGYFMNGDLSYNPTIASGKTLALDRVVLNMNGANRTFDIGTGLTMTYANANIVGTDLTLIKTGGGILEHSSGNGMAFFLQVVAGEYRFGNFNRLGRAVTIEADGTLNLQTHYQDTAVGITLNGGTLTASGASSRFVTSAAGLTSTGGGDVKFTGAGASTAYLQLGGNVAYNAGAPNKALVFTDGELRLGAATRTFTVADGAQAIDVDVQAQITGTDVGIIKDGLGTMRLGNGNGNHTYTGPTTVNAGTLIVQGNIASSSLTTVNGGTLMGDGTVGALDLNGGVLAPGNSVGQLDAGNTTWDNFDYEWEINSVAGSAGGPTGWDLLDVTGTLDVGSGIEVFVTSLTLAQAPGNVSDFDPLQSYIGIWNIATASGGVNNFSASDFTLNFSQWTGPAYTGTWSVSTDANNVYVNYTAGGPVSLVPEPSTVFLWLSGGLALWSYRRRRA